MKTYLKLSTSAVALLGAALMISNPAYAFPRPYDRDASNVNVSVDQSAKGDVNGSSGVNSAVLNSNFAGGQSGKVTGNVGINNAAGTGNVQANAAAINVGAKKEAHVNTDVDQQVGHTWYNDHDPMTDNTRNPTNLAEITDSALMNASGNIGVNNAAGHGNLQSNTLAVSVNTSSYSWASADSDTDQKILGVDNQSGSYVIQKKQHFVQFDSDGPDDGSPPSLDGDDYYHPVGHNVKVPVYGPQALIIGNALEFATGRIGVNNAAGNGNAQSNALTVVEAHTVSADGSSDQSLWVQDNSGTSQYRGNPVLNNASIGGNALAHASGDIGVNNAAGDFNAQSGTVIVAAALTGGTLGDMSARVSQHVGVPSGNCETMGNVNNASLGGNALQYASGAISVNNAAGVGNAQSNMLVLGSFVSGGSSGGVH